jgi:CRP-like cAMP-binding protein
MTATGAWRAGQWQGPGSRAAPCRQCLLASRCPMNDQPGPAPVARGDVVLRSLRRGSLALREGERPAHCLFVKAGLLLVSQTGLDGVTRAIAVIGAGALLGFTSAHVRQGSLLSARALTPVSACELPAGVPDRAALARHTRQGLATLTAWSQLMRIPTLAPRLAAALHLIASTQPGLSTLLPSQATLAELLCVTRESVNRCWREMEAAGIVQRRHGDAVSLDLPALERVARGAGAAAVR